MGFERLDEAVATRERDARERFAAHDTLALKRHLHRERLGDDDDASQSPRSARKLPVSSPLMSTGTRYGRRPPGVRNRPFCQR